MYQYVLFDLDGTLTDPGEGITNSVAYALKKYGIEVADRTSLYPFIGPPLHESFQKFYGFSEEESMQAVAYYREYYRDRGIYENEVYEGIPEVLQTLREQGKTLLLATSKPEAFAIQILEHFQLLPYFHVVAGATMDGSRVQKGDVIRYALEAGQISDLSQTVMVGDRRFDIEGAKENGFSAIGVLYGYGDFQELSEAGAKNIIEHPQELLLHISE